MEIDIFPIPSAKGVHRYIGTSFLGLIIITYIVGAYKIAQQLIGEDKELLCFLVTIPIFIGGYAVFVLSLHGIKQCLYAYFKSNRKELNNRADRENMDACIIKHLEDIQKKLETKPVMEIPQRNVIPQPVQQEPQVSKVANDLKPKILPELEETLKNAQRDLAPFIQQLYIDRIQLTEAKEKQEKDKLEKSLDIRVSFSFHTDSAMKSFSRLRKLLNCLYNTTAL